jgi:Spy/CpxP family protein refolding chaperone
MNRTLKLSLLCGGIFLSGAVAGGFAVRQFPRGNNQPKPETFGPQQLRHLTDGLDLTKEQKNAIKPILQKTGDELKEMRKESIAQATRVIDAMDASVAALLTPVQRERLKVLRAEERVRMKTFMEERQRRISERENEKSRPSAERRQGGTETTRPSLPGDASPPPPVAPESPTPPENKP